jgi:hypothetical protein
MTLIFFRRSTRIFQIRHIKLVRGTQEGPGNDSLRLVLWLGNGLGRVGHHRHNVQKELRDVACFIPDSILVVSCEVTRDHRVAEGVNRLGVGTGSLRSWCRRFAREHPLGCRNGMKRPPRSGGPQSGRVPMIGAIRLSFRIVSFRGVR